MQCVEQANPFCATLFNVRLFSGRPSPRGPTARVEEGQSALVAVAHIAPITLMPPAALTTAREARDAYGRQMTYLRISLTDRCNFRCVYCMPALGMKFQPRAEHLTDDELLRL